MRNLGIQYFVFDKSGNHILEASVILCENEQDFNDKLAYAINAFKTNPDFADTQLTLSSGNEILFSSIAQ